MPSSGLTKQILQNCSYILSTAVLSTHSTFELSILFCGENSLSGQTELEELEDTFERLSLDFGLSTKNSFLCYKKIKTQKLQNTTYKLFIF